MKLSPRNYNAILNFLRTPAVGDTRYMSIGEFSSASHTLKYCRDEKHFHMTAGNLSGSVLYSVSPLRRITFNNDTVLVCRSTASLVSTLFRGYSSRDSNQVHYFSTRGMVTDDNLVPIIYSEKKIDSNDMRVVVNSYVFRRENILSKFILDTLCPLFMDPSYRKCLFEDPNACYESHQIPRLEVVFRDITSSFWINKLPDISLNEEIIANFTRGYFNIR